VPPISLVLPIYTPLKLPLTFCPTNSFPVAIFSLPITVVLFHYDNQLYCVFLISTIRFDIYSTPLKVIFNNNDFSLYMLYLSSVLNI